MGMKILASFDLPEQYVKQIQRVSPNVTVIREWDDDALLDAIKDVEALFAGKINQKMIQTAKKLRWIHSWGAGVDRFLAIPEVADGSIIITNSSGVHPIPISEHVISIMLAFTRKLREVFMSQNNKNWATVDLTGTESGRLHISELNGKTVGIIGLGNIGNEIARKAKCFGMTVLATRKKKTHKPPFVDELLPHYDLQTLLQRSDFVVISLPLTPETKDMIGKKELETMKKTAYLINIARGKIIDQKALITALKKKQIAGAGLDVFEVEPLPYDSELWNMKNVIVTPHIAGETIHYWQRAVPIFCENLKRYLGQRPLINLIDKKAGY